ncbi:MAG: SRPBCC family protein [Pyrinomonadaceae bacterium]
MLKKAILGILVLLVIAVAALIGVVAMQPDEFSVIRDATFNAPPERIFEQVNDFHKWQAWSPWAKIDPAMKTTYSGPATGVGSSYAWTGNSEVGEGKMTISESKPNEQIKIDLDFIKPFEAKNVTSFTFKPDGGKTTVTWKMSGKKNFMMKAFGMVMDMDKVVGGDFEKGLAQLKPVVESPAVQ